MYHRAGVSKDLLFGIFLARGYSPTYSACKIGTPNACKAGPSPVSVIRTNSQMKELPTWRVGKEVKHHPGHYERPLPGVVEGARTCK